MLNNRAFSFVLIALFLWPIFALTFFLKKFDSPFDGEFFSVFSLSFLQALLSAGLTLMTGLFAALGLTGIQNRKLRKALDLFLLWPSFVPSLLVLVSTLNMISLFVRFPFGFWGVVILHVVTNSGLIAVLIARLFEERAGGLIEVATVEGARRWPIVGVIARELSGEIYNLFYFLFVLCFTSFAIPLIVGMQSGRTLETLIYQKLVANHQAGAALPLSFIQIALLFMLSSKLIAPGALISRTVRQTRKIHFSPIVILLLALTAALAFGATHGLWRGLNAIEENQTLAARLVPDAWGTALECGFVALFSLIFCALESLTNIAGSSLSGRFFRSYAAPSAAVLGLSLVIMFAPETWSTIPLLALIAFGPAEILPSPRWSQGAI